LFWSAHLAKTVFQSEQIARYIGCVGKKFNGEEDEKILFDPKNNSPKIVWSLGDCH
jgi:hypothetical protein